MHLRRQSPGRRRTHALTDARGCACGGGRGVGCRARRRLPAGGPHPGDGGERGGRGDSDVDIDGGGRRTTAHPPHTHAIRSLSGRSLLNAQGPAPTGPSPVRTLPPNAPLAPQIPLPPTDARGHPRRVVAARTRARRGWGFRVSALRVMGARGVLGSRHTGGKGRARSRSRWNIAKQARPRPRRREYAWRTPAPGPREKRGEKRASVPRPTALMGGG